MEKNHELCINKKRRTENQESLLRNSERKT